MLTGITMLYRFLFTCSYSTRIDWLMHTCLCFALFQYMRKLRRLSSKALGHVLGNRFTDNKSESNYFPFSSNRGTCSPSLNWKRISDCCSTDWWALSGIVPFRFSGYQYSASGWWSWSCLRFFSSAQGGRKTLWHGGCRLSGALRPQLAAQRAPSVISYVQQWRQ